MAPGVRLRVDYRGGTGETRIVVLPLGAAARARLAKAGALKVRLITRVVDAVGNAATPDTRFATLRLKPAKRAR